MRNISLLFCMLCAIVLFSCKKQSERQVIFVDEPKEVIDTTTIALQDVEIPTREVEWGGAPCFITVKRITDKQRPVVKDNFGHKYYDTKITVRVVNKEGKTFFERDFTKDDFSSCVDAKLKKKSVLLGLPFTEVENGMLTFRGSVGSPDPTSDEYDPVVMRISHSASFQVAYDNKPDFEINNEEEGV